MRKTFIHCKGKTSNILQKILIQFRSQKTFGSQYEFSSSSSQEPKVRCVKEKSETDGNNTEIENLSIEENHECNETTQSTQDSCYSWSGVSQEIDIKGEKRELSDEEDEPCENLLNHSQLKNQRRNRLN